MYFGMLLVMRAEPSQMRLVPWETQTAALFCPLCMYISGRHFLWTGKQPLIKDGISYWFDRKFPTLQNYDEFISSVYKLFCLWYLIATQFVDKKGEFSFFHVSNRYICVYVREEERICYSSYNLKYCKSGVIFNECISRLCEKVLEMEGL